MHSLTKEYQEMKGNLSGTIFFLEKGKWEWAGV